VTSVLAAGRLRGAAPHIAVLVVFLIVYIPVIVELVRDWIRDPNYSHGFLIPLVSGFIIWSRREKLRQLATSPANLGLLGILAAGALLILGTAGAEVFTQRVSMLLALASLTLFLFGWGHLRLAGFPIALMLFAIPLPYVIYYGLTGPLQLLAAKCAVAALRFMGVHALAQGNMIHLPNTSLEVADACSGIRSLYAFLSVGALMAYATSGPFMGRLLLFLATIPLSVAGNALRVWGTGLGAYFVGPEAAHGTIHEVFGLTVFAVSLGIFLLVKEVARKLW